jgi:hypothetical protein
LADGIEGREYPRNGLGATCRVIWKQAGITLPDVQNDRAGLEQFDLAVLPGRNLAERTETPMLRRFEIGEGQQTDIIGLSDLFQRPPDTEVARQGPAAVR